MITSSPVFMSEKSTKSVTMAGLHEIEKFFPSVNLTLKYRYPSSYPCEIQSTFFPWTSGYRLRSFSCLFLIRFSKRRLSAALMGFMGIPSTIMTFDFFSLMSVAWRCVPRLRSGCRRAIRFAAGVNGSVWLACFLRALPGSEKLNQWRFAFLLSLAFDLAHQPTDFFVG